MPINWDEKKSLTPSIQKRLEDICQRWKIDWDALHEQRVSIETGEVPAGPDEAQIEIGKLILTILDLTDAADQLTARMALAVTYLLGGQTDQNVRLRLGTRQSSTDSDDEDEPDPH